MSTSTLGYALLGLLAREPLSGYDLAGKMKKPVGFFWPAKHSQIYPELAKLAAQGLVTHQVVEQDDRPDKKIYALTGTGRQALAAWVASPLERPVVRDELVLRAFCLWLADPSQAAALFRAHEREHAGMLARYQEIAAGLERECGADLLRLDTPGFASYAALRRGIGFEREYMEWCAWVAEVLERGT